MGDSRGRAPDAPLAGGLDSVREFWDAKARDAATDCERVDASRRAQRMRFERFVLAHDLRGRSVLDVGCGVGDLWDHLKLRGVACDYLGVDLSPEMAARAQARFADARFEAGDILQWGEERRFDYVVAIAIHNVRVDGGRELLERLTRKQFALARVATHLSLLTDRFAGFDPHIQPWRAEQVLTMALAITPYVTLWHDYMPHDFGVTLYHQALIDARSDLVLG